MRAEQFMAIVAAHRMVTGPEIVDRRSPLATGTARAGLRVLASIACDSDTDRLAKLAAKGWGSFSATAERRLVRIGGAS